MVGRLAPKKYRGPLTDGFSEPGSNGESIQPAVIVTIGPDPSRDTSNDSRSVPGGKLPKGLPQIQRESGDRMEE
jgi:hypothetical protein